MNLTGLHHAGALEIEIPENEVLRYLGCNKIKIENLGKAGKESEAALTELVRQGIETMRPALDCKACFLRSSAEFPSEEEVRLGPLCLYSRKLAQRLRGCSEAVLFAATIGVRAERLLLRESRISPGTALILDAVGSAAIEAYCDVLETALAEQWKEEALCFCERFSPGYGDLSLEVQPEVLRLLDAQRKIGLSLTAQTMMVPSKSVTAILGIRHRDGGAERSEGCAACTKTDCAYRKE